LRFIAHLHNNSAHRVYSDPPTSENTLLANLNF
jgi:hypothetical protein